MGDAVMLRLVWDEDVSPTSSPSLFRDEFGNRNLVQESHGGQILERYWAALILSRAAGDALNSVFLANIPAFPLCR